MAQHSADTPCPTAHTGSAQGGENKNTVSTEAVNKDINTSLELTLLGDELCENSVHGAAVCQVIRRSGAVRDEQRLVSSTLEKIG